MIKLLLIYATNIQLFEDADYTPDIKKPGLTTEVPSVIRPFTLIFNEFMIPTIVVEVTVELITTRTSCYLLDQDYTKKVKQSS